MIGHLGHPAAYTPTLDALVSEDAVSFANAFVQATVCTPSRCSFMTGWYPHVRGHRTMHHVLNPNFDEPNLLKVLRDNGYYVWWGGKNDLVPGQLGFEFHCDQHFRPRRKDYERWGVTPMPGSHGGDMSWRGDPDCDNYFSFYKGKLPTGGTEAYFDHDWRWYEALLISCRVTTAINLCACSCRWVFHILHTVWKILGTPKSSDLGSTTIHPCLYFPTTAISRVTMVWSKRRKTRFKTV